MIIYVHVNVTTQWFIWNAIFDALLFWITNIIIVVLCQYFNKYLCSSLLYSQVINGDGKRYRMEIDWKNFFNRSLKWTCSVKWSMWSCCKKLPLITEIEYLLWTQVSRIAIIQFISLNLRLLNSFLIVTYCFLEKTKLWLKLNNCTYFILDKEFYIWHEKYNLFVIYRFVIMLWLM